MLPIGIDELDARLITTLADTPRAGVMELARQLGVCHLPTEPSIGAS
jgi:hypothetical protein